MGLADSLITGVSSTGNTGYRICVFRPLKKAVETAFFFVAQI
jgi:hypothetical protein